MVAQDREGHSLHYSTVLYSTAHWVVLVRTDERSHPFKLAQVHIRLCDFISNRVYFRYVRIGGSRAALHCLGII